MKEASGKTLTTCFLFRAGLKQQALSLSAPPFGMNLPRK
jgi:hypothetical protein